MQQCGVLTSKHTPCRLNRTTCRFHQPLLLLDEVEMKLSQYTKEEQEIISEFSRGVLYATIHHRTFDPVWLWHESTQQYYTHIWVNNNCDDVENCLINHKPCIIFCQCSGCFKYEYNNEKRYFKNETNKHCVRCQCRECVCPMRKTNQQYESFPTLPHPYNICAGTCYICNNYTIAFYGS